MSLSILDQIVLDKRHEVEGRMVQMPQGLLAEKCKDRKDFRGLKRAMQEPGVRLIAEIKRASPSKGALNVNLDPTLLARQYEAGGASALSVLTESKYFLGSDLDMLSARSASTLPVLRKDFIIHEYQVYETVAMGADAMLLIARILDDHTMRRLHDLALKLGLDVLAEVHNTADLRRVQDLGATMVGINNRDLSTFHTDLSTAMDVAKHMEPSGQMPIALSGISSIEDVRLNLSAGVRRFLIGETLVKSGDPVGQVREIVSLPVPEGLR